MPVVFLDGQYLEEQQALLPLSDRGLLFGDGVFRTLRVEEGKIQYGEVQLERLSKDCQCLGIEAPSVTVTELEALLTLNGALRGLWRLKVIVTAGEGGALDLRPRPLGRLLATVKPYTPPFEPYRLAVCQDEGFPPGLRVKSLSYLPRLRLRELARLRGCDEVLTLSREGYILQAASANVFWRFKGELCTPSPELPLIYGTTIERIVADARASGVRVNHVFCRLDEVAEGARFYLCNSLLGEHPVAKLCFIPKFFKD